jgi:hypothetical protein
MVTDVVETMGNSFGCATCAQRSVNVMIAWKEVLTFTDLLGEVLEERSGRLDVVELENALEDL